MIFEKKTDTANDQEWFNALNNGRPVYTYNQNDKWDKKVYEGPFSYYLAAYRGYRFIEKFELEVVSDLKMPTKKERVDEFIADFSKNKSTYVKDLKAVDKALKKYGYSYVTKDGNYKRFKTQEDIDRAYEIFNHAMESTHKFKSTQSYMNRMSKNYDAMVDDNNQGHYNEAHDPVIIFDPSKVKVTGSKNLSPKEVFKNYGDVDRELSKRGKRVRL